MTTIGAAAAEFLLSRGIATQPGLSESEIREVESHWGFRFGADHRYVLAQLVPVGGSWVDWRHDTEEAIAARLDWPANGVLFDVEHNAFWPDEWGSRPPAEPEALVLAASHIKGWARLVPVFSHRYMAADAPPGAPVLSVYQTDVIVYGGDLRDYLAREFGPRPREPLAITIGAPEPWARIMDGWGYPPDIT